jgi:hypothetical protein
VIEVFAIARGWRIGGFWFGAESVEQIVEDEVVRWKNGKKVCENVLGSGTSFGNAFSF